MSFLSKTMLTGKLMFSPLRRKWPQPILIILFRLCCSRHF